MAPCTGPHTIVVSNKGLHGSSALINVNLTVTSRRFCVFIVSVCNESMPCPETDRVSMMALTVNNNLILPAKVATFLYIVVSLPKG